MFRAWKFSAISAGWMQPFEDAPDAGGGGGEADPIDAGDGSQLSDGDVDAGEGMGEVHTDGDDADRDDDLDALFDDDDDGQTARSDAERIQALVKKNRKIRKQLARSLPMVKRLKGVDLEELFANSRNYQALSETIRRNPKLRALVNGGDAESDQHERTPPAAKEKDEDFDEKALPFDPSESDTNRWLANHARETHETRKQLKALQARLDGHDSRETQRTEGQVKSQWESTIKAAARHITDDAIREMFMETCAAHYLNPASRAKNTPQQVVSHYLRRLKVDPSQAAKANRAADAAAKPGVRTAATQQRIAENNKNLPRTSAVTGNPAPARNERATLASVKQKIRNLAV